MKIAVIALTKNGSQLAMKIGEELDCSVYIKRKFVNEIMISEKNSPIFIFDEDFKKIVKEIFFSYEGIIFIMACGIVVRSIAPHIKEKTKDPAVVVVDEKGQYAISLLSGHIGGGNQLTEKIASVTKGTPIITTATDINGVIAFDMFAINNHCVIENIEKLKYVSAKLVNGGKVFLYTDYKIKGTIPSNIIPYKNEEKVEYGVILSNRIDISMKADCSLFLRPKNLVLGIGCRKNTSKSDIKEAIIDFLALNKKSMLSVKCLASIDIKSGEKGILEFCEENNTPFITFSREQIKGIEDKFSSSSFVKNTVGVGNVAETCAILGAKRGKLLCNKTIYKGITLALAEEDRQFFI